MLKDVFRGEGVEPMPMLYVPYGNAILMIVMNELPVFGKRDMFSVTYFPSQL